MAKLILFNMITPEGYFERENGALDWHNADSEFTAFAIAQLEQSGALLFGRRTFEMMREFWSMPDPLKTDPIVALHMNRIKKYVVSRSLVETHWEHSQIIAENLLENLLRIKQDSKKDILIFGSAQLANSFMELGLIDEFRFLINPTLLGNGNAFFRKGGQDVQLKLTRTKVFDSGNVLLCYGRAQEQKYRHL